MSHWLKVQTEIRDLNVLEEALHNLNPDIKLVQNVKARGYSGKTFEWVIRLPGLYDVGLTRPLGFASSEVWEPEADMWMGHVERVLGRNCEKLVQEYATVMLERQARRKGYMTRREKQDDGTMKLYVQEVC